MLNKIDLHYKLKYNGNRIKMSISTYKEVNNMLEDRFGIRYDMIVQRIQICSGRCDKRLYEGTTAMGMDQK